VLQSRGLYKIKLKNQNIEAIKKLLRNFGCKIYKEKLDQLIKKINFDVFFKWLY